MEMTDGAQFRFLLANLKSETITFIWKRVNLRFRVKDGKINFKLIQIVRIGPGHKKKEVKVSRNTIECNIGEQVQDLNIIR